MHRFAYRNFGSHQTLVGNFTVGGGNGEVGAAIRWFELRNIGQGGWTLFQEGTHDPGDGHDRFMGSIAMDEDGNIALGYSVSSSTLFPGIRYATRTPGDPARHARARSGADQRRRLADRLEPVGRLQRDVRRSRRRLPVLVHERVLPGELHQSAGRPASAPSTLPVPRPLDPTSW